MVRSFVRIMRVCITHLSLKKSVGGPSYELCEVVSAKSIAQDCFAALLIPNSVLSH